MKEDTSLGHCLFAVFICFGVRPDVIKKGGTMNTNQHAHYLSLALHLAAEGRYSVSPNPMVGCVIVKNNHIVGQGYHQRAGDAHAEVIALQQAKENAQGATAYVTLEPCCHHGKTPPCTHALIAAGIKEVYVACSDPNPLVAGKGISDLRAAGIRVQVGILQEEARQLNEIFFHFMQHKRPFVMAKWAMSLDGKMSVAAKDDKQISSTDAQYHTHQLRRQVDAILIGAGTAREDNPQLTARYAKESESITRQPLRIILMGQQTLPVNLKIFSPSLPGITLLVVTKKSDEEKWRAKLTEKNDVLRLPENKNGLVDLPHLLDALAKRNITSLLVEGGRTVHESFFNENLVNKTHVYLAPTIIGSGNRKQPQTILHCAPLGCDFHFTAEIAGNSHV